MHPTHWALVIELDTANQCVDFDDLVERVRERATVYDVLRYGVKRHPWKAPELIVHTELDLADNVSRHRTAHPLESRARIDELMATPLKADQPLWQLELIEQVNPSQQLLVMRVHHAVSDGLAGAGFGFLFADGDNAKLREFERFLDSPRLMPSIPPSADDPVLAFTKSWLAGMTLRRQLPRISARGERVTSFGSCDVAQVRAAANDVGVGLSEHLVAATGRVVGQYGRRDAKVRIGAAVSLDASLRHTGNATSVINIDIDAGAPPTVCASSVRDQVASARAARLEMAFVVSQQRAAKLPWPVQRAMTRISSRMFRTDAAISINPLLVSITSVLGSNVRRVYGLVSPVRFPLGVVYLLSPESVSFGVVADPRALTVPIERIAHSLERDILAGAQFTEVTPR